MSDFAMAIVTNIPAIICLVLGYALVVVELYIPGFGLPGICGSILLIVGVCMVVRTALEAFILVSVILLLIVAALLICVRSASHGRLSRSKLVLQDVATNFPMTEEGAPDYSSYAGKTGTASTILRPAGIAEFDGVRLNVVTAGEFVSPGASVRVMETEGNRVVVAEVRN